MFKNKNRNKYSAAVMIFFYNFQRIYPVRQSYQYSGGTITIYAVVNVRMDDYGDE
jgi:hypothetical protein